MNSSALIFLAIVGTLLITDVYGRPQAHGVVVHQEEVVLHPRQAPTINIMPAWIMNVLSGSSTEQTPVIPVIGIQTTTRRPQLADIIGNGLQGLFQGIVRAPGQIANRVQGIIDGIIRRPTTTVVPPVVVG